MVDYCTLTEVKRQIATRSNSTVDDVTLTEIINDVSREIDQHCFRHFYGDYQTRVFDVPYGSKLFVDEDLVGVTLITNGDGTTLSASDYVLLPPNRSPKYAIELRRSSSVTWDYDNDPLQAIQVEGTWGFNDGTVPPDVIKRAAIRLSAWRYSQRDAPFNTRGFPQTGMVEVPTAMPTDVEKMLSPFIRRRIEVMSSGRQR